MKISKKQMYIFGGVITILLIAGVSYALGSASQNKTNVQTKTQDESKTAKSPYADAKLYKIGEIVKFQSLSLLVNSVKTSDTISSSYGSPAFADKGTKFIIVNMTLVNITDTPFTFSDSFVLLDQKDRLYNGYSGTIGNIDDYITMSTLSPSVPKTGNDVYQVPLDSTTLRLGGEVGNTGEKKFVQFNVN